MKNFKFETFTIPEYYLIYIAYGETNTLQDDEINRFNQFVTDNNIDPALIFSVLDDEPFFLRFAIYPMSWPET